LSGEWEDMLIVEEVPEEPVKAQPGALIETQPVTPSPAAPPFVEAQPVVQAAPPVSPKPTHSPAALEPQSPVNQVDEKEQEFKETVEEIKFYLRQEMIPELQTAMGRLVAMAPERPVTTQLQAEVLAAVAKHAHKVQKPLGARPVKPAHPEPVPEFSFELNIEE